MSPRSVLSVLTVLLLALAAPLAGASYAQAEAPTATFSKPSTWGAGWEGRFTLTNASDAAINGWRVEFDMPSGSSVGSYWDALLTKDGQRHTFQNRDYNATIPAGGSVTFGFLGNGPGVPENCTFNGGPCTGGSGEPDRLGTPGTPTISAKTETSLTLGWAAGTGSPTGYRVYEGSDLRATVTGTTATISGLAKCSTHSYTVKAYDDAGESPASTAVTGTTDGCVTGPLPKHFLTGYWHDFVNAAREIKLSQVPDEYDVVAVAFGESTSRHGEVSFRVDPELAKAVGGYTDEQFKADIKALQAKGKKVILSVGGEKGAIWVGNANAATLFTNSMYGLINEWGFDGVDIDLENGISAQYMGQALRALHAKVGNDMIITMAPQTVDMQNTGAGYFQLALNIKDILTVVHMQYYNSGTMLGCDQQVYSQGTLNFMTALACIQLENGLRPDQVALGLPAGAGAAGGGVVQPGLVNNALDCLAKGTNCGSYKPSRTYPGIRGAMTWSINWDLSNGGRFAGTVGPHLDTLP
ncbi:chitinase [Actinomadura spongiicola]|uniref:chitinase n=1 Tax=Actinomadura spongiicola TaxID=2303421 RepID=UPI001F32B04E|nr:cellulose binding domain-containing protein [Actinomadura spongiicola]